MGGAFTSYLVLLVPILLYLCWVICACIQPWLIAPHGYYSSSWLFLPLLLYLDKLIAKNGQLWTEGSTVIDLRLDPCIVIGREIPLILVISEVRYTVEYTFCVNLWLIYSTKLSQRINLFLITPTLSYMIVQYIVLCKVKCSELFR